MDYLMDPKLMAMLAELFDAKQDLIAHQVRYPTSNYKEPYISDGYTVEVVREDWTRCLRRHQDSVKEIENYAESILEIIRKIQES